MEWQISVIWAALAGVGIAWTVLAVAAMWCQAHRQRARDWGYPTNTGPTCGIGVWVCLVVGVAVIALSVLALMTGTVRLGGIIAPLAVIAVAAGWVVRARAAQIVGGLSALGPPPEPVVAPLRQRRIRDLQR